MEANWVAWLQQRTTERHGHSSSTHIGDDSAHIEWPYSHQLACADMLVEGVHFEVDREHMDLIGRKALAVNLSDIAAMGGAPRAALVTISIPPDYTLVELKSIYSGLFDLADEFNVDVIGGDTVRGPLTISVTVLGQPGKQTWTRSGAKPGDRLLVTGPLGGSLSGHHLRFEPRVHLAGQLSERYPIHAAIDISDGLSLDLSRICEASGCGSIIQAEQLPISDAAHQMSARSGKSPLQHALCDGEDFELLLSVAPEVAEAIADDHELESQLVDIGEMTEASQMLIQSSDGTLGQLPNEGYDHLAENSHR